MSVPYLSPSKVWAYRETLTKTEELKRKDRIERRKQASARSTRSTPHFENHAGGGGVPSAAPHATKTTRPFAGAARFKKGAFSTCPENKTHLFDVPCKYFPSCVAKRSDILYDARMERAMLQHSTVSSYAFLRRLLAEEAQEERLRGDIEKEASTTRLQMLIDAYQWMSTATINPRTTHTTAQARSPSPQNNQQNKRILHTETCNRERSEMLVAVGREATPPPRIRRCRRQHASTQTTPPTRASTFPFLSPFSNFSRVEMLMEDEDEDDDEKLALPLCLRTQSYAQQKETLTCEITDLLSRLGRFAVQTAEPARLRLEASQEQLLMAQLAYQEVQHQLDVVLGAAQGPSNRPVEPPLPT